MADPYYDGIVGVDEGFLFPPEVMAAIAGSKELTAVADRLIQSYTKAISDNNRKQYGSGEADPTAPEDLVPGRFFYNTTEQATKQYNGKAWQVVGGPVEIPWADFAVLGGNYQLPDVATKNVPRVYRTGKRIDIYATIWRKRSLPNGFIHGEALFTLKPGFEPSREGSTPMSCVESGGGASASVVGGGLLSSQKAFVLWSPKDPNLKAQNLDISGTYYTV